MRIAALLLATLLLELCPHGYAEEAKKVPAKPQPAKAEATKAQPAAAAKAQPAKAAKAQPASPAKTDAKSSDAKPKVTILRALFGDTSAGATPAVKTDAKPAATATAKDDKQEAKKPHVVRLTLRGEYPEGPTPLGVFGDLPISLQSVIRRLGQAAEDAEVAGVWLRIDDLQIGVGKVHELRAAIGRLRKAGKPIVAELTSGDARQYQVALACEQIFMPPSGMLQVPGVRAEVTFFKGLLDKLGIQFDLLQQGKFKAAGEPFTRTRMSPEFRESLDAVLADVYDELVAAMVADRRIEDYKAKTLVDEGLFSAVAAKRAGLVDELLYADEIEAYWKKRLAAAEIKLVTDYKQRNLEAEFSGLSGMMKFLELMFGGDKKADTTARRKIAVVYAVGPIMEGKSQSDLFGASSIGSSTMVAALRKAAEDAKVAAVVLRIDSPGGSAVASDLIWREITRMKKPVIASMGDVAASGGYYIAMGARKIFAEPNTITGSIGVIGGKPVMAGLYSKLGISVDVISRGKNSGAFSLSQPFSAGERRVWTELMEETYRQFVDKAAAGRKLPRERLEQLAQGRIYSGKAAVKNRLVDALGTLHDAVAEAKRQAGIKADEKVELMVLPQPKSFFEQLFGDPTAAGEIDAAAVALAGGGATDELRRLVAKARSLQRMLVEPAIFLMPADVQLK